MARKKLKRSVGIVRLDSAEKLPGYSKVTQVNYERTRMTLLAHGADPVVVMIDNDPAKRYMIPPQEVFRALMETALKDNTKGAKHANARRD